MTKNTRIITLISKTKIFRHICCDDDVTEYFGWTRILRTCIVVQFGILTRKILR